MSFESPTDRSDSPYDPSKETDPGFKLLNWLREERGEKVYNPEEHHQNYDDELGYKFPQEQTEGVSEEDA